MRPLPELFPVTVAAPVTSGPSTRSMTPAGIAATETPIQLAAREAQNEKQLEAYRKNFSEYNQRRQNWEKIGKA